MKFRSKCIDGPDFRAVNEDARKVETVARCNVLNPNASLGPPQSVRGRHSARGLRSTGDESNRADVGSFANGFQTASIAGKCSTPLGVDPPSRGGL